jgi:hypothetical protein
MRFAFKTAPERNGWTEILSVWREADSIDLFETGWLFDHFYPIRPGPGLGGPGGSCLEGWTMLSALAQATERLRLGILVSAMPYRHPAVLANMAAHRRHHLRWPAQPRNRCRGTRDRGRGLWDPDGQPPRTLRSLRRGLRGPRQPALTGDHRHPRYLLQPHVGALRPEGSPEAASADHDRRHR